MLLCLCFMFFCFKQKTAYEMRISDWSADVCSSDLGALAIGHLHGQYLPPAVPVDADRDQHLLASNHAAFAHFLVAGIKDQIRERLVEAALGKGRQAAIELLVDRRDRRGREGMAAQ